MKEFNNGKINLSNFRKYRNQRFRIKLSIEIS